MTAVEAWKQRAMQLKTETYALYLAYQDPRTPWYARWFAALVVGYAFSPIDLIPDFIPVLGYLDDLILVPLGAALVLKMIPSDVLAESREKAKDVMSESKTDELGSRRRDHRLMAPRGSGDRCSHCEAVSRLKGALHCERICC